MSDRYTVAMAAAAAGGALVPRGVPLVLALGLCALAFAARRPTLLVIGVALLTSAMSARSWAGLTPPQPTTITATATLLTDPEPIAGALRVELRVGHRHLEAWARGGAAGGLYNRLAGERVEVAGGLRAVPATMAARLARRHIAAQLNVDRVGRWWPGSPPARLANGLRRTLLRGASSMPDDQRSLFSGFVLGDDRGQPPTITDDFRGSGLSHLLVVSGENVAFVLALAAPVLRRTSLRSRLALGLAVLFLFGVLTRWEPSVLRAEAMAAIAMTATVLGRPASAVRVLALAVTGLLVVDPMLVRSVGFLLSVGACTGIALLAGPIAHRLPGPRPIAAAMAVTIAAQVGVAPVLIPIFGPLPMASIPANLVAIPAAGPIVVWGMTSGVVAGWSPAPAAALLHIPTRVLIGWVALVARVASRAPLGHVGLGAAMALAGALILVALGHRRTALVAVSALVVSALLGAGRTGPNVLGGEEIAAGLRAWRQDGATLIVVGEVRPDAALAALRQRGIGRVDLAVLSTTAQRPAAALDAIKQRVHVRAVLRGGSTGVVAGDRAAVGPWQIEVRTASPRVTVVVCAHHSATVAPCS
ncbi:MAG: ComEC/Rec2 family competence protein [Actinobacteria bacterium]|nr:ComEC/Rec2 family competence protein [Actinomycetota bacterium]